MCDYSLHHVGSRAARVDDKLVTTELARSSTRGFAAVGEQGIKLVIHDAPPKVAVCLMPGTELAFDECVQYDRALSLLGKARVKHKLARFRQVDMDDPHVHHDALEFPDGQVLKVTRLVAGQTARVLQLPVSTPHSDPHHHDHLETDRVVRLSDARLALNRVSSRPGLASVLMPSQGTVMLWQTCRSSAFRLTTALEQSFRRLTARKWQRTQRATLPAGAHAVRIETNFVVASMPPKSFEARKPDKKTGIKTAA